ncbi:MAG: DNA repair protein RecO [Bdellovibrionaceae bacterium]|nr:DNA repair protein RecO [Pseudobdellovibrionaceae bacterium]
MKYGEADLIIHALSPLGEKLSFIARSAMRSKKRFGGGVLEPSHFVQFTYKQAKFSAEGSLNTLNEATLLNDFRGIRKDYDHLELALHILDCISRVCQEGDRNSEALFNLLGNTLTALESSNDVKLLKILFYLKFLYQQGVLTVEEWMTPFLQVNMTDINTLTANRDAQKAAQLHLSHIESATQQYVKTAEHH